MYDGEFAHTLHFGSFRLINLSNSQCVSARDRRDQKFRDRDETETLGTPYTRSRLRLRLRGSLIRDRDWDWDSKILEKSRIFRDFYLIGGLENCPLTSPNPLFEIETETETLISRENRDETRFSSVSGVYYGAHCCNPKLTECNLCATIAYTSFVMLGMLGKNGPTNSVPSHKDATSVLQGNN